MKNLIEKNNFKKVILILISYIICFVLTRFALELSSTIYFTAMNIVQGFYFLAVLNTVLYIFHSSKSDKTVLTISTIGLIAYSTVLYLFIKPIVSWFVATPGIFNFVEYSTKIYFIALPLLGFVFFQLEKKHTKKLCFLLTFKILIFLIITLIFHHFFMDKGVLYSWPLSEFTFIISLFFIRKRLLDN